MLDLLRTHFTGVSDEQFAADLAEKTHVVLLEDGGVLRGFTTLLVYDADWNGQTLRVVYSGDTIVAPEAWGTNTLARTWIHAVYDIHASAPTHADRLVWLLLTSGYRTYRFLPVFWKEFFPRFDAATPGETQGLLDRLAAGRFDGRYSGGIVRFARPQVLAGELLAVPKEKRGDPHVEHFLALNPGYVRGDELVCLTELTPGNLTRAGQRMVYG